MSQHTFEAVLIPDIAPLTEDITFDERDALLLGSAIKWRAIHLRPMVGDYCILANGEVRRLAYETKDRFNVTSQHLSSSFHLMDLGTMSCSGAFPRSVLKSSLVERPGLRSASAWMFHHGRSGAHRGVDVIVPCRVFVEAV